MTAKQRIRVKAGSVRQAMPKASYLRDTRSAVISTRPSTLRASRDDIRVAWRRAAAIANDLVQNSGRLRGAVDQVIADTVGIELVLNPQPDLSRLGYDQKETVEFSRMVKRWWKRWAWNPRECDLRGKFTVPQMIDIALRWDMVYGEALGIMSYMTMTERKRYGLTSGTKVCMSPPTRLVQDTNEMEGLFQGVIHDPNGRPVAYRLEDKETGIRVKRDYRAHDADWRQQVIHVFDPMDATDVRGISRIAPGFRQHIQHEILVDATVQTAILQTVFAAALTSQAPSKDAFEALAAIEDDDLRGEMEDYFAASFDRAADSAINISGDPQVSHLAPGEELKLLSTGTPGPQFQPLWSALSRDMARAIGITYGGLTMDHSNSTYSSVRMENSSIWPVVMRRRERLAGPIAQAIYENALDEAIGEGRIPFKGGYRAFAANRDAVCWALWQGPAKPSADDGKSAKAASERLGNGTSTLAAECAELGYDPDEVFEQRVREHALYREAGMASPFERRAGRPSADPGEDVERKPGAE
ncbi:phage portal protein [Nitratireductor aquimarinus]|uniref:phage portal protein n=1 Tax=Nitratireductor aquimarinus TaxID=889300 RepID=UPI0029360461|nr:phage portal protein [Nitratireductor aquimarinus]MDV2967809.1 phage portal protein [Nitratireductor aquimarinus]